MIDTMFNEGGASGLGFSEVESYLRCPKEYQYDKVRGIHRPTAQSPDYFAVGSFLHAGRARWLAEKQSTSAEVWDKVKADVQKVREGLDLPCSDDAERTALRYIQEYIDHWSVRPKPDIVAVEHMLGPTKLGDTNLTERTARLDDFGFYPEAGGLAIGECKTTSAAISDVANQYTLHGQPMLQRILWDIAPQGAATYGPVKGMVLDVVQKGYGGKRCQFARLFVPVLDRAVAWFRHELTMALYAKAKVDWNSDTERRVTSCTRLIGRGRVACPYRELCMFGKSAALEYAFKDGRPLTEWQEVEGQQVNPWD